MGLGSIASILVYLGGELIGDSAFFLEIFSGKKQGTADEKRKLIFMPFLSAAISAGAIAGVCAVDTVSDMLLQLCIGVFPCFTSCLRAVKGFIRGICEVGVFSKFSYVASYVLIYTWLRKPFKKLAIWIGESWLKRNDEFGGIYIRDSFGTKYVLSTRWEMIYHWICALIGLDMITLGLLHTFVRSTAKSIVDVMWWDLIPCAILSVLMEAAGYLSAQERTLWQWLKRKRDKQAADCSLNMVRLESTIEKYAVATGSSILKRLRCHQYNFPNRAIEYIESRRTDEDAAVQYLLDYIEKEIAGRNIPIHTIDAAIRLVKGENLFITNSFYRDLDVSIFFPVFMALLKDEKALVMVEDNGNLKEIVDWVCQGIEGIQNLTDFWTVDVLRPMVDSVDVGVLAFQEICKGEQLAWCREFLDRVSFVVILEASNLLTAGQDIIMSLSSKIGRQTENCTWMLTDHNAESMIDLYSHLLDREFLYVSATPYFAKETLITYWNTEKEDGRPWSPHKRYLGAEAALAGIAVREKIGRLHWYGEEMMPIRDLHWLWGQYYEGYQQYTGMDEPYQMRIDENIEMEVAGSGNHLREQQFIVIEDEYFNLFEKGRQYATRGIDKVCVCILSPNYLLRDYMKANYQLLEKDPKYIPQFAVEHVDSKRNIALRILRRLLEEPVSYTELKNTLAKVEEKAVDQETVLEILKKEVELILPDVGDFDISVTHKTHFSEQSMQIECEDYFQIVDEGVKRKFRVYFNQAIYIDEMGNSRHISQMILGDHLDQKYVKGQFVVFDGKYYEIVGRMVYNGAKALRVKRASDQIYGRKYYRILRTYEMALSSNTLTECSGSSGCLIYENQYYNIFQRTADELTAETIGYVETDDWGKIKGAKTVRWKDTNGKDDYEYRRKYIQKQFLVIRMENADPKAELIMAAFMKEIFCTLYPQHYHLLDVAVDYSRYGDEMTEELKAVISEVRITEGKADQVKNTERTEEAEKAGSMEGEAEAEEVDNAEEAGSMEEDEKTEEAGSMEGEAETEEADNAEEAESMEEDEKTEETRDAEEGEKAKSVEDMRNEIFIIEDSREDMGLLRSIERNILKILSIQKDYTIWSIENGKTYFKYGEK